MASKTAAKERPTIEQYSAFQAAYDYFNKALWGGKLSPCVLVFTRRKSKARGHFSNAAWSGEKGVTHEISLTADILKSRDLRATFGTLVHEMCHQWQHDFGNPSKAGYHNAEWGDEMERAGLTPTDTGLPGGKRTGTKVTHLIVEGGPYDKAFASMPDGAKLPWLTGGDDGKEKPPSAPSKVKYVCQCPKMNVWGKPYLTNLYCIDCKQSFEIDPKDLKKLQEWEKANGGGGEKPPEPEPETESGMGTIVDSIEVGMMVTHAEHGEGEVLEKAVVSANLVKIKAKFGKRKRVIIITPATCDDITSVSFLVAGGA
jgi:hypothetical protein